MSKAQVWQLAEAVLRSITARLDSLPADRKAVMEDSVAKFKDLVSLYHDSESHSVALAAVREGLERERDLFLDKLREIEELGYKYNWGDDTEKNMEDAGSAAVQQQLVEDQNVLATTKAILYRGDGSFELVDALS